MITISQNIYDIHS